MGHDTIFQATDLATSKRVEFLDAARHGGARLRDKDGTSLVMMRESRLNLLELLAEWNNAHLRLEALLSRSGSPSVSDLGELAWLRVFDRDDLQAFVGELHEALVAAHADGDLTALQRVVDEWRVTASQLNDPLRRSVLVSEVELASDSFDEVERPHAP